MLYFVKSWSVPKVWGKKEENIPHSTYHKINPFLPTEPLKPETQVSGITWFITRVCTPPWTHHKSTKNFQTRLRYCVSKSKASIISSRKSSGTATTVSIFRATTLTSSQQQANSTVPHVAPAPLSYTHKKGVKYVFAREVNALPPELWPFSAACSACRKFLEVHMYVT